VCATQHLEWLRLFCMTSQAFSTMMLGQRSIYLCDGADIVQGKNKSQRTSLFLFLLLLLLLLLKLLLSNWRCTNPGYYVARTTQFLQIPVIMSLGLLNSYKSRLLCRSGYSVLTNPGYYVAQTTEFLQIPVIMSLGLLNSYKSRLLCRSGYSILRFGP
jgi:hypothetical protein